MKKDASMYDRVTEILREEGHPDPENAAPWERFEAGMRKVVRVPKSAVQEQKESE